jgi:hypothetical protein
MKRDMDLVREILLFVEQQIPYGENAPQVEVVVSGHTEAEIDYHVGLLQEAGLLDAIDTREGQGWIVNRLTWSGHEFLDASRSSKLWEEAKSIFRRKSIGMTFDGLKLALGKLAARATLEALEVIS